MNGRRRSHAHILTCPCASDMIAYFSEMADPPSPNHSESAPWVEIGWVVVPSVSDELQEALVEATREVRDRLSQAFPHYDFRNTLVRRSIPNARGLRELVDLLDLGTLERDAARWDFACVVTDEDLRARDKPFTFGAPASSLNVCALSTARLRPAGAGAGDDDADAGSLVSRLSALFFHLFGHLNDLPHASSSDDYMYPPHTAADLDEMRRFSARGLAILDSELSKEADLRVEEEPEQRGLLRFYLASAWRNRADIVQSVIKAQPWSFVLRLSKLATTAISTLIILMLTAEAWDVGTSQTPLGATLSSVLAVAATASYVLRRQGLLRRARGRRLSEQRVASNVSIVCVVLAAMLTTYICLFLISLTFALLAFPSLMLGGWVTPAEAQLGLSDYLVMAAFVATFGVVLGALGASFEGATYFRHATIVDEET